MTCSSLTDTSPVLSASFLYLGRSNLGGTSTSAVNEKPLSGEKDRSVTSCNANGSTAASFKASGYNLRKHACWLSCEISVSNFCLRMGSGILPLRKPGTMALRMNAVSTFWYSSLISAASAVTVSANTQGLDSFFSTFIILPFCGKLSG